MTATIRISVEIPDAKKSITEALKRNSVIDRVDVSISSYGSSTVTCSYDDKKYASIDKNKLERELKETVSRLGYRVR